MNDPMGILVDQLRIEVEAARTKGLKLWEERLQLWIRPKPDWIPKHIWQWLISLILVQRHTINPALLNASPKPKPDPFLGLIDPNVSRIKIPKGENSWKTK